MNILSRLRRLTPAITLPLSVAMLVVSLFLVFMHTVTVRQMKEIGLPAALQLPAVEKRMEVLREQNDVAELQAHLRGGTEEEMLHVYVLPDSEELDRLLMTLDVLFSDLENKKMLTAFSPVEIGEATPVSFEGIADPLRAVPVTFEVSVTEKGLSTMLLFFDLSGLMTISDVLTPEEIQHLLNLTEEENPAAITALEHFLSHDLLRYAEEPKPIDSQLLRSFPSGEFEQSFRSILGTSRLQDAVQLLSGLRGTLRTHNLWPLRLLSLKDSAIHVDGPDKIRLKVKLEAYARGK